MVNRERERGERRDHQAGENGMNIKECLNFSRKCCRIVRMVNRTHAREAATQRSGKGVVVEVEVRGAGGAASTDKKPLKHCHVWTTEWASTRKLVLAIKRGRNEVDRAVPVASGFAVNTRTMTLKGRGRCQGLAMQPELCGLCCRLDPL